MKKLTAICILLVLISTGSANAAFTLTFDELPTQPVDGLSYMGITFGFEIGGIPSTDAVYNGIGPGTLTYLQDPTLEGNAAGILTLDFATPTNQLQFGAALNSYDTVTPGYTVTLYDPASQLIGVYSKNTYPLVLWSEDQFTYSGTPVSRATIGFNNRVANRFSVDNLTFNPVSSVPAPGAILLSSIGLGLVNGLRRRRML